MSRPSPYSMPATAPDGFEEWLHAPMPDQPSDARFEVRRAQPAEFDRIYDLVDAAFDTRRPRAFSEWLYRRNPRGLARCVMIIDKRSKQLVASGVQWPWPAARGAEPLEGVVTGDGAVAPRWQRQGLNDLRIRVRNAHPWFARGMSIGWPNMKSAAAARKHGRGGHLYGPLPRGVLVLRTRDYLARRGWPPALAAPSALASDAALNAWQRLALVKRDRVQVEAVRRFDAAFDAITAAAMTWQGFWCPHDAAFLNWRYLDHPTHTYVAFAATTADAPTPIGYYVVRIDGARATLMELACATPAPGLMRALLSHAIDTCRTGGCTRVGFFATPGWPAWPFLRRAGFLSLASDLMVTLREPGSSGTDLSRWQLLPGDCDAF